MEHDMSDASFEYCSWHPHGCLELHIDVIWVFKSCNIEDPDSVMSAIPLPRIMRSLSDAAEICIF